MQYWIIVNVHWIPKFELPSSCHSVISVFLENNWLDIERLDGLWHLMEKLLLHSRPWPWVCGLGLGLACLWPWLNGLGLDTPGPVNIPELKECGRSFVTEERGSKIRSTSLEGTRAGSGIFMKAQRASYPPARGLGELWKLPIEVRGWAPAKIDFVAFPIMKNSSIFMSH